MSASTPTHARGESPQSSFRSPSAADQAPLTAARWPVLLSAAVILGAVAAVYISSFPGAMVLDDHPWILDNPAVRTLPSIGDLVLPHNAGVVGGRPVVSLTLALNYAVGGINPFGYHLVNLLIHALACLVLFGIVRRTLLLSALRDRFGSAATPLALSVALVWGVHPLSTAAVTYIVQRSESLMALFYLLTLYCVIRGATIAVGATVQRQLWYMAAVVSCLLGMVTKEVMLTAPLVILLYDGLFLTGSLNGALKERRGLYASLAATWSFGVLMLSITGFHGSTTGTAVREFTWQTYLQTEPGVILHYLRLAFWPAGLCLDYNWPPAETIAQIIVPGTIIIALLGLTIVGLIKRSPLGFLGAAFFLILAPTSSFVPNEEAAFDHRMYLPLAALVALVIIGAYAAWNRFGALGEESEPGNGAIRQWGPVAVLTTAIIALGWATIARNNDYRTEESIWRDVVAKRPDNWRAYASLGDAAKLQQRTPDAIDFFEKALKLNQNEAHVHLSLGDALAEQGKIEEAIYHDKRALDLEPKSAKAHNDLATALVSKGSLKEAEVHLRKALELDPDFADARCNLAGLLVTEGKFDDAVKQAEAALAIEPDFALAHANLGLALLAKGQSDSSILHFRKALELDPRLVNLESELGKALGQRGEFDQAIGYLKKDLERKPNNADAHFILASLYDKNHQIDKAIVGYRKVLELNPSYPAAHVNLGAILEQQGELDEAIGHFTALLDANPDDAAMHLRVADLIARQGEFRKARDQYRTALSLDPQSATAHKSLGNCYIRLDQPEAAIEQFQAAIEITPNDASAHNTLAMLLGQKGDRPAALMHFTKAAELDPNNADTQYYLGMIYYSRDEDSRAATHWRAAARLRNKKAGYLRPLAWLLATSPDAAVRNGAEAVQLAEQAVELEPLDPNQLGTLAAADAEAGQFPKAVANAERALELAIKQSKVSLADELTDKLKLYRSGTPYREKPRSK